MKRSYLFAADENDTKKEDSIDSLLSKIAAYPECIKANNFGVDYDSNIITSIRLTKDDYSIDEEYVPELNLSKEDRQALYEAVLADIDAGNLVSFDRSGTSTKTYPKYLSICYRYARSKPTYPDEYDTIADVFLTPEATHTIDALIKLGVINTADDLK